MSQVLTIKCNKIRNNPVFYLGLKFGLEFLKFNPGSVDKLFTLQ